ncbi:MAG: tetratricopeptide repeat protein, partial [Thermoanaerobaculia bacterium]
MEFRIKGKDLFRKILTINHPFKPEIENFSFHRDEGIIHFKNAKELNKKDREFVEAGYSHYGLYFSSKDIPFPDIMDKPEEKRVLNYKNPNLCFWQERFPEGWKEFLKKPLFLFAREKKVKGFTAISKYFYRESLLAGKKVFYFNIKDFSENTFENFLKLKGNKKWQVFVLDHLGQADQENFEKFLFFILKAPFEGYEIVASQWPGRSLPEGDFIEIPRFSYSEFLKIFYFPALKKEDYLNLIEENLEKCAYFPSNLVEKILGKETFKEKVLPKVEKRKIPLPEKELKEVLKEGRLFQALPFLEEIKKRKQLYELFLAWQGDWETLFLILKKPQENLLPVIFFLGWDGFVEIENLRDFLPEEIYFFLKNRKENFLERLEKILERDEEFSFYLKLIYADKIFSSGIKEAEKIFEELKKKEKDLKPFEEAQLYRFLSYFNFYKGDLEKAICFNKKWIEISEKNDWLWQMPLAFNDLAVLFMEKKDYEGARRSAQTALNFSFFLPEEKKESTISFNLAVILTCLEEFEKALEIFKKLEKAHREKGDFYSLVFELYEISRVLYLKGELEDSIKYLMEAEEILKNFSHHPRAFQIFILKTKIHLWFSKEDYKKSLNFIKNFENYPPHLKFEIEEILSEGALRNLIDYKPLESKNIEFEKRVREGNLKGIPFNFDSLEKAIKVFEWNLFCPEKVPKELMEGALNFIEKKNLEKWKF